MHKFIKIVSNIKNKGKTILIHIYIYSYGKVNVQLITHTLGIFVNEYYI